MATAEQKVLERGIVLTMTENEAQFLLGFLDRNNPDNAPDGPVTEALRDVLESLE